MRLIFTSVHLLIGGVNFATMELALVRDCESLIDAFIASGNLSFQSFTHQWKKAKFYYIYKIQSRSEEVIQATNICLHLAKRMLLEEDSPPKLGGLFLMYAIYFKQPTYRFHKIEVDMETWLKLKEFIGSLGDDENSRGAKYIFWHLVKEEAFRFVASDVYRGLEGLVNLNDIRNSVHSFRNIKRGFVSTSKQLTGPQGLFTAITTLNEGYTEMKELMAKEGYQGFQPVISNNFEELEAAFASLNKCLQIEIPRNDNDTNTQSKKREAYEDDPKSSGVQKETTLAKKKKT